jgi:dCTP deaminase
MPVSVLSDASLREMLGTDEHIGPSSQDIHLGDSLLRLGYGAVLDPDKDQSALWSPAAMEDGRWWVSHSGLYLGVSQEEISVPGDCVALLHGVSSLGRLGLMVHVTAGVADPGFFGKLTLELVSLGGTILLRPGMRIGQITYHRLDKLATRPYSGRYLGDMEPTPSRSYQDGDGSKGV